MHALGDKARSYGVQARCRGGQDPFAAAVLIPCRPLFSHYKLTVRELGLGHVLLSTGLPSSGGMSRACPISHSSPRVVAYSQTDVDSRTPFFH